MLINRHKSPFQFRPFFHANKTPRALPWDALATERGIERDRAGTVNYLD